MTMLDSVVRKGQPFAKRNKERRIRKIVSAMQNIHDERPAFRDCFIVVLEMVD